MYCGRHWKTIAFTAASTLLHLLVMGKPLPIRTWISFEEVILALLVDRHLTTQYPSVDYTVPLC